MTADGDRPQCTDPVERPLSAHDDALHAKPGCCHSGFSSPQPLVPSPCLYTPSPTSPMMATLARLPRRTTRRAGKLPSVMTELVTASPSILTAFSASLRLASAPLAARPHCIRSLV